MLHISEIIQGLSIWNRLISLGLMSSRFIWVRLQRLSVNESRMWQNQMQWAILLRTLCVQETEPSQTERWVFLMNLVNLGKRVGIRGSYGAFYGASSSSVKPAALVLSHTVIWFGNCIVEVTLIEWKLLTQMMGMSPEPLVKLCLCSLPTLHTGMGCL